MKLIIFCILTFFSFKSNAQEEQPRYTLPVIETRTIENDEYKCANVSQWKQIILITSEYNRLYDWRLTITGTLDNHYETVELYESVLTNRELQIETMQKDREYLRLRLKQELEANAGVSKRLKLEKGLLWAVIAVETVIIGVIGVKGVIN